MDEYEKLEAELKKIYEEYIIKFRCQVFMFSILEEMAFHLKYMLYIFNFPHVV